MRFVAMNVDYHAYAASVMFVGCVIKTCLLCFCHYCCLWFIIMLVCISYCSAKVGNLFLFDKELMLSFDKKMQSCVPVLQFVVYMTCLFNI